MPELSLAGATSPALGLSVVLRPNSVRFAELRICWLSQALLSLQDNGSGAGSPPRGQAEADYDSVFDADTAPSAPSAKDSAAGSDLQNEATQPRPAAGKLPRVTLSVEMCCTGKKITFLPCPAADAWPLVSVWHCLHYGQR